MNWRGWSFPNNYCLIIRMYYYYIIQRQTNVQPLSVYFRHSGMMYSALQQLCEWMDGQIPAFLTLIIWYIVYDTDHRIFVSLARSLFISRYHNVQWYHNVFRCHNVFDDPCSNLSSEKFMYIEQTGDKILHIPHLSLM